MKHLYLIVGKSGSGKSTIVDKYCKKYNATQVMSYTTRPVRVGEIEKPTHKHVSVDQFKELQNEMIAYDIVEGHLYGATLQQCLASDFYVINKKGIEYFLKKNVDIPYKIINIESLDSILYSRMCERDGKEKAMKRIESDKETDYFVKCDYNIENNIINNLDKIVDELHSYITQTEKGELKNEN